MLALTNWDVFVHNFFHTKRCDFVLLQESGSLEKIDEDDKLMRIGPLVPRGPSIVAGKRWASHCLYQAAELHFAAGLFELAVGTNTLLISLYLPDSWKTMEQWQEAINSLDKFLSETWETRPWQALLVGGDFNCTFPRSPSMGDLVSGRAWDERCSDLLSLAARWQWEWSSTFAEFMYPYTHIHKSSKVTNVLDYICSSTVAGTKLSIDCHIDHLMNINSDHFPIFMRCDLNRPRVRPKAPSRPLRWTPHNIAQVNRFQALVSDGCSSSLNLESFCSVIQNAVAATLPPRVPKAQALNLSTACAAEVEAVKAASTPLQRLHALKILNSKKRNFIRSAKIDAFQKGCLQAPRLDKMALKKTLPLSVQGTLTFDAVLWDQEFRMLYSELFGDGANNVDAQSARLQHLRLQAAGQEWISIPVFMVNDALAAATRKSKTCPGTDGISWSALANLPHQARAALAHLFEQRINCMHGHCNAVAAWCEIVIQLIPKTCKPSRASQWRPLAITSCMQKLYTSIVAKLVDELARPTLRGQAGFTACRQTAEIAEFVRLAVQKSKLWGNKLFTLKADVHRAFDAMFHDVILDSLVFADCPVRLQHAVMLELHACSANLSFQGHSIPGILYNKGGKQGGAETPTLWKRVLDMALHRAGIRWQNESLGVRFGEVDEEGSFEAHFQAWADDVLLFSDSLAGLQRMFVILTEELHRIRLNWKPGSLEVHCIDASIPDQNLAWAVGETSYHVKMCGRFNILGVGIDRVGSTLHAIEHRIGQAWLHWHAREAQFKVRSVPLRMRWQRLQSTVFRTFLHGAGGWTPSEAALHKIQAMENSMLKLTLCRVRGTDESDACFHTRLNSKIKDLKVLFCWHDLSHLAVDAHFAFWGHVARMESGMPIKQIAVWRDASWFRKLQASGGLRPKLASRGRPWRQEDSIELALGPDWKTQAADRTAWRAVRKPVAAALWGAALHKSALDIDRQLDAPALVHFSNRLQDLSGNMVMQRSIPLLHCVDNMQVAQQSVGLWASAAASPYHLHSERLRWGLYTLQHRLKFIPLGPNVHLMRHIYRDKNRQADYLANAVLNLGVHELSWCTDTHRGCECMFVLYSDGASRNNPGLASAAAVLCAVTASGAEFMVAYRAVALGIASNVAAEFEAAIIAQDLLLGYCCRVGICSRA